MIIKTSTPLLFLMTVFVSIIIGCTTKPSERETTKELISPNIVWIVSEDNSPYIGCYGDKIAITPNIDKLSETGIQYNNAFANAPVCAPSRSTMITGMYPISIGSQHMRSQVEVPDYIKFFPNYLKEAGYYTSLRVKRDYNIPKQEGTWDKDDFWEMSDGIKDRKEGQPFFMFYNTWMSHESKIHDRTTLLEYFKGTIQNVKNIDSLVNSFNDFDQVNIPIPPNIPTTSEVKSDMAWYYKAMQMMDYEVGNIMAFLKEENLLKNTIIIYSSDHGGVIGRSKRFNYETGLHIPMIVSFPEKYKHLSPLPNGQSSGRLVSFVDMAPTILSLADINKPDYMQGNAFLGNHIKPEKDIVYGFRGRMDEAYDMVRTIRDKKYRYIRNYMPYRPNGQHIDFLWKAKSIQSWDSNYKNGKNTIVQNAFFKPRLSEELYDISNDPHNIHNLANDPNYKVKLLHYRKKNNEKCRDHLDVGFIPEGELWQRSTNTNKTIKDVAVDHKNECLAAISAGEKATLNPSIELLEGYMKSEYAAVRFWGATGCIISPSKRESVINLLIELTNDISGDVAVTSAEALLIIGKKDIAVSTLKRALIQKNVYVQLRALNVIANRKVTQRSVINEVAKLNVDNEYIKKAKTYILNHINLQ